MREYRRREHRQQLRLQQLQQLWELWKLWEQQLLQLWKQQLLQLREQQLFQLRFRGRNHDYDRRLRHLRQCWRKLHRLPYLQITEDSGTDEKTGLA